jgi:hypothetical protein
MRVVGGAGGASTAGRIDSPRIERARAEMRRFVTSLLYVEQHRIRWRGFVNRGEARTNAEFVKRCSLDRMAWRERHPAPVEPVDQRLHRFSMPDETSEIRSIGGKNAIHKRFDRGGRRWRERHLKPY